jgi:hypothetical protein
MGGAHTNKKDNSSSVQSFSNGFKTHCGCLECYHPSVETLDYDYTAANQNGNSGSKAQYPRIRERGEFYIDSFNDQPWSWSFGTNEMVCIICSIACDTSVLFVMCFLYRAMCVCIGVLSCHISSALPLAVPVSLFSISDSTRIAANISPYSYRYLSTEWNLVQLVGSSRFHHVLHGMATHDILSLYRYHAHYHGRDSHYSRHAIYRALYDVLGLARQDKSHRSRKCTHTSDTQ